MAIQRQQQHFLIVTVEAQGHINPARRLARHLANTTGSRVTVAIPNHAYRLMFPSTAGQYVDEDDGRISYTHYSNGMEDGFNPSIDLDVYKLNIKQSLSRLAGDLATRERPVTCIIYALLVAIAADVARDLAIPSVHFWIQPATVFAIYNCYFQGYADVITAHEKEPDFAVDLPGLPRLRIRDLPSFLTTPISISDANLNSFLYFLFKDIFETLHREPQAATSKLPRVLLNTFEELEAEVISSVPGLEMIAVGPLVSSPKAMVSGDLYEEDSRGYMEWLDSKAEQSVVYVSFGSISKMSRRQMKEIAEGLSESGRPYLWVVRRDNRSEEEEEEGKEEVVELERGEKGMVVEWCSQVRVLSHRSIGCFVTHCGWNSTLESMVCGVPMVMVPQWTDQATNARMAEEEWGTGVRAAINGEDVLEGKELRRCLDVVMGDEGVEIRMKVQMWRDKGSEAVGEGGSSDRNLKAFVESIAEGSLVVD